MSKPISIHTNREVICLSHRSSSYLSTLAKTKSLQFVYSIFMVMLKISATQLSYLMNLGLALRRIFLRLSILAMGQVRKQRKTLTRSNKTRWLCTKS
jgi:hypothetical protein